MSYELFQLFVSGATFAAYIQLHFYFYFLSRMDSDWLAMFFFFA